MMAKMRRMIKEITTIIAVLGSACHKTNYATNFDIQPTVILI